MAPFVYGHMDINLSALNILAQLDGTLHRVSPFTAAGLTAAAQYVFMAMRAAAAPGLPTALSCRLLLDRDSRPAQWVLMTSG